VIPYRGILLFVAGLGTSLAAGWIGLPAVLYERTPQPVQFSHKTHSGTAGMKCEDCHAVRDDGTFSGIPALAKCAECHAEPMGTTAAEKQFVEKYVKANREVPWHVYSRQPDNAHFSHANHVKLGKVACETCHGGHGKTETLRPFERNRISGYSRDIWGPSLARFTGTGRAGMKMDDCMSCHRDKGVQDSCLDCHK
jgi:hypothetical protein